MLNRTKPRKNKRATQIPAPIRQAIYDRAGGMCDACGGYVPRNQFDAHHRQLRSRGGPNTIGNLVCLHHTCHMWIHANPDAATHRGLMVHSWDDPHTVPVIRADKHAYLPLETWTLTGENQ